MNFRFVDRGYLLDLKEIHSRPYWFQSHAQAPNVVVEDSIFRVYFSCRGKKDRDNQYVSYLNYAEFSEASSKSLLRTSESPLIPLGKCGMFDEHGTYPMSVLKEEERYLGFYGGWSRSSSVPFDVSIGLVESGDGLKFRKTGEGPILTKSVNEPFVIGSPKIRKIYDTYFLFYIAGQRWTVEQGRPEIFYRIRCATSKDLVNWARSERDLISPVLGETEAQACPDVFQNESGFHMFFCFRKHVGFRTVSSAAYRIGYAHSPDLVNWVRDDNKVQLLDASFKTFSGSASYPNIFEYRSSLFMLYLGSDLGVSGFRIAEILL